MNLNVLLQQAIHDFQAGNLGDAKKKFKKILAHAPQHIGTLNYLSLIYTHEQKYQDAEVIFKKILHLDQTSAQTYYNYSLVLKFLKKYTLAVSTLDKAIQLGGPSEEFDLHKASLQALLNDKVTALSIYDHILKRNPKSLYALHGKGKILLETYQFDKAQNCFEQSVAIDPKFYEGWTGLGESLFSQSNYDASLLAFENALGINDITFFALKGLAKTYAKLNRRNDAIKTYNKALSLNQNDEELFILFASDLIAFKNFKDASDLISQGLKHFPQSSDLYASLGYLYLHQAEFERSKKTLLKSLDLKPNNISSLINLGSLHSNLDDPEKSLQYHQTAIEHLDKSDCVRKATIKFFMSFEYFKLGDLQKAYPLYEAGMNASINHDNFRHPQRLFHCPRWEGQPLPDKRLMIWSEQGLGDQLYFLSCIPVMEKLSPKLILEVDARLIDPIQRSFPNILVRQELYESDGHKFPLKSDFDYHISMGSLMQYVRPTLQSYQASKPYLRVDAGKQEKFKSRLTAYKDTLLIGICWRSGLIDKLRSCHYFSIEDFKPILELNGVTFVNLQYSDYADELKQVKQTYGIDILCWDDFDLKNDLDDVTALMAELDMIITAPTAVRSMGAAVGAQVLTLAKQRNWINFGCDHDPWFENSSEIPFYKMEPQAAFEAVIACIDQHYYKKFGVFRS